MIIYCFKACPADSFVSIFYAFKAGIAKANSSFKIYIFSNMEISITNHFQWLFIWFETDHIDRKGIPPVPGQGEYPYYLYGLSISVSFYLV